MTFVVEDQDGEKFELMLAGFGTYSASKKDAEYDTISVSGGVTGIADAPYKVIRGSCGACNETPDTVVQTQASAVCDNGICTESNTSDICTESNTSDVTPVYGSYSMKYNKSKSVKAEKYGATRKTLGLPSYVVD